MIVRKLEALFTINTNAVQFKKAASQLDGLASKAETVMKTIAGYWAVQALQNFVTNTAKAMAEVGKTAEYLGVTAEALQELHYAAEKSGVSVDALNDAIKEIQVRATDAKSGQGEAAEAFKMLGLSSTDAAGRIREPLELLDAVADRLKALPSHSERIWIADAIFGDEGSMVLKMLKDGSLGLRNMRHEARSLGLVLDSEGAAKAARFNVSLKHLGTTLQATANSFVQGLMRPLSWLMEKVADLANAFNQLESRASIVRVTLLSLSGILSALAIKGGVMLAAFLAPFLPLIGIIAGVVAGIVAVSLVVDDLWVAFQGGESAIGRDLQKCIAFFDGLGTRATKAWQAMSQSMRNAVAIVKREFPIFTAWFSVTLERVVDLGAVKNKFKKFRSLFSTSLALGGGILAHTALGAVRQKIANGLDEIKDRFASFGETLAKTRAALRNRLSGIFDGLAPSKLVQRFAAGMTFLQEKFSTFPDAISTIATALKEKVQHFLSELVPDSIKQRIADGLNFIQEKFAAFQDWITGAADALKQRLANVFDGLLPDFVKKGFLATIKHVSSPASSTSESPNLNARLAPTPANILHQNRVSSNQSVNVAVNVKSGANPQEIGAEVAKVFKKEFERERFNAFMGVSQYAG